MWGVSITSAIVQTTLSVRLPEALGDVPNKWKVRPYRCLNLGKKKMCTLIC